MLYWVRWKFNLLLDWIRRQVAPKDAWQCHFCHKVYTSNHPKINAYKDGKPIYQCEECRIRLDIEETPTDPRIFDSDHQLKP